MDNYPIPIGTGIKFPRVKQYTLLLYCSNHELQYTDTTQLHVYTVPIQYRNWIVQTQIPKCSLCLSLSHRDLPQLLQLRKSQPEGIHIRHTALPKSGYRAKLYISCVPIM